MINKKENSIDLFNLIKQAFIIKNVSFPWEKAINAGICVAFPMIISLMLNKISLGLLGGLGSFTYLYVVNEPYAQRAKKIFFVAIGISISVALGTLVAPYPILIVLIAGLIGSFAMFVFGVFKIPGPSAIFFILTFTISTNMELDQSAAIMRGGIVLIAGLFSWVVAMIGYFFNPHNPEIKALKGVYFKLSQFSEGIGTEKFNFLRHETVNALRTSEETIMTGYIPWKSSSISNKFNLLNEEANKLFIEMLELADNKRKLPKEISNIIKQLSRAIELIDNKNKERIKISHIDLGKEYNNLLNTIYNIQNIIEEPLTKIDNKIKFIKPSLKMKLTQSIDKDSMIFINAIRYGIILSISAAIAYYFNFNKPYWIPLTCAAVMSGSTVISTFNRAIQRSCGTIVGVIIVSIILKLQPSILIIVVANILLTTITELFIVKNYAIAVIFITSNALLLAEAGSRMGNISYFVTARVIDILIGSMIGLIGTFIIGRRSASSKLPDLMIKLINSQSNLLFCLLSSNFKDNTNTTKWQKEKMKIDFINFKTAYNTALGEIPNNEKKLEMMWPAFFSLEHITYLLDKSCIEDNNLSLEDDKLAKILFVFKNISMSIEEGRLLEPKNSVYIEGLSKISEEINILQIALSKTMFN